LLVTCSSPGSPSFDRSGERLISDRHGGSRRADRIRTGVDFYPKLGYDPAAFVPMTVIGIVPNALVANPNKLAATTLPEFIAYARANPG
jgi:hypothetical protein